MEKQDVLAYYKKAKERLGRGREAMLRDAYENVLFWLGHQHITFDAGSSLFRRTNPIKGTPRPVENLYKPKLKKPISKLSAISPQFNFAPGSDEDSDRITADNARLVMQYVEDVVRMPRIRRRLAYMVGIMGNAYTLTTHDPMRGTRIKVARFRCPTGGETVEGMEVALTTGGKCPEHNAYYEPIGEKLEPQGQVSCEALTLFHVWCDYSIPDDEEQPVYIIRRMRTREWLKEHYPSAQVSNEEGEGSKGTEDLGMTYLHQIVRLSPNLAALIGSSATFTNAVIVDDVYALPCKAFPKGLAARIAQETDVLESKALPYHDGTDEEPGQPLIPIAHFGYDETPGSHLCTTPASDLRSVQRRRNKLLAHIILYFARSAAGVWAIPDTADVSTIHGTEGVIIRYQATTAGGGVPARIEGGRLPTSFGEEITRIDVTMNEMVTGEADPKEFPRADSAAFLNTLSEAEQERLGPVFRRLGESSEDVARHLFLVFRQFAPDEVLFKIKGEEARWTVKKLRSADLRGGVDIRVEASSVMPRTMLQKRAAYEQMVALGVVDINDPSVKLKYSRALGAVELMEGLNKDQEQIAREHDTLIAWAKQFFDPETGEPLEGMSPQDPALQLPVLVDPDLDLHPLHWEEHRRFMLGEAFNALPMYVQQAFRNGHLKVHKMVIDVEMAQQAAMMQGPPGGGGGGQPGSPGQQEQARSGRENARGRDDEGRRNRQDRGQQAA